MDWLSRNKAVIACAEKIVRIPRPEGGVLEVSGDKPRGNLKMVSCMKMRKYLRKECTAFLAHVVSKESKEKNIHDIPIVRDFPEVFPDYPHQDQLNFTLT